MIYRLIKWLSGITLKSYFRKVVVKGREHIPSTGPVIIVANHPSAYMDPMVIGACTKRSLHFVAAAEFMGRGLKSWIYRKQLNMIPVYRSNTQPGQSRMNVDMFSKCHELLAGGGAVLIFPEGNSITEKRIRKLKTGTARMALGARDHFHGGSEVTIVPVGLNYANPHRFQSELFVNIGEPVTTKGFSSDHDGIVRLTSEIEDRLREAVVHVKYEELDSVVKKVELIMKSTLQNGHEKQGDIITDLQSYQRLVQSIQSAHELEPETIRNLEILMDGYLDKIRQLHISDSSVATLSPFSTPAERFQLWAGRPLFILGFLLNAIPYYSTVFFFRSLNLFSEPGQAQPIQNIRPSFRGSVAMSVGMVVFIHWYLLWAIVCAVATGMWWLGPVTWVAFYLTGQFTLRYIGWTLIKDQKKRVRKILGRNTDLYAQLIVERRQIVETIKKITREPQLAQNL
jgi:glycerol-3-phosphate O-acyltransferase/dihydroxyacetone phosphate acyltransferase